MLLSAAASGGCPCPQVCRAAPGSLQLGMLCGVRLSGSRALRRCHRSLLGEFLLSHGFRALERRRRWWPRLMRGLVLAPLLGAESRWRQRVLNACEELCKRDLQTPAERAQAVERWIRRAALAERNECAIHFSSKGEILLRQSAILSYALQICAQRHRHGVAEQGRCAGTIN